jgi:hypothetical protein
MKGTTTELAVEVAKIINLRVESWFSQDVYVEGEKEYICKSNQITEYIFSPEGRKMMEEWLVENKQIISMAWFPGRGYYEILSYPCRGIPLIYHKGYDTSVEIALALVLYELVKGKKFEVK